MVIPGAHASNGGRIRLTDSNNNLVEIFSQNQIIAQQVGTVSLDFNIPEDENFAAAFPRSRTLTVVKPTKSAWLQNRKNDPRYNPGQKPIYKPENDPASTWSTEQAAQEFDSDHFDSDGDGYSNLFERASRHGFHPIRPVQRSPVTSI